MAYTWSSDLESGVESIDKQHRQLVTALNDLLEACRAGRGHEELINMLEFLTAYTIKHFADEEKVQVEYAYPDYPMHKRIHDDFKHTVKELSGRFRDEGASDEIVRQLSISVGDWLVNHIKGDDFRLAAHVNMCRQKQA